MDSKSGESVQNIITGIARRRKEKRSHRFSCRPDAMQSDVAQVHALPPGCERGEVVVAGIAAAALPDTASGRFKVFTRFVEGDDFDGILELTRSSGSTVALERKFSFGIELTSGQNNMIGSSDSHYMEVTDGNLLHYALCVGKFDAVVALLVVCPGFLSDRCQVSILRNVVCCASGTTVSTVHSAKMWTALELIIFFRNMYVRLYQDLTEDGRVLLDCYNCSFAIVMCCDYSSGYGMLFGDGSLGERMAAVVRNPGAFIDSLHRAARTILSSLAFHADDSLSLSN